jgi:hypothetical protein
MQGLSVVVFYRVALGLLLVAWVILPVVAQSVTPTYFEATISPGEAATLGLQVRTGATPVPRIDVVFVIDITGSMSEEIDVVQSEAETIMNDIRELVPDSYFGLATFSDYPGTYSYPGYSHEYGASGDSPWTANQQPTGNTSLVEGELAAIETRDGRDHPEDYTRVLWEAMSMDWRALTKKIVIVFGDAPTHDLDFAGYNNGGDPGRNAVVGGGDDLDFETVVGQLNDEGVVVLAVYSGGTEPKGEATFRGMSEGFAGAEGTGGQFFLLEDAADIPQAIHDMVEEEVSTITLLDPLLTEAYRDWCAVTPTSFANVGANQTRDFSINITVPAAQEAGIYSFMIQGVGDGALLGSCVVEITVPGGGGDLDLGFLPSHDGFGFENRTQASIPWAQFEQQFGRDNVLHANGDRIFAAESYYDTGWTGYRYPYSPGLGWEEAGAGGLCYGFSSCSIINFADAAEPNAGEFAMPDSEELYADTRPYTSFDQAIWFYHGSQMTFNALRQKEVQKRALGTADAEAYLGELEEYIRNDTPVVFCYWYAGGAHAVVPYRIEVDDHDPDISYVYVYDSNPGVFGHDDVTIEFDLNTGDVTTRSGVASDLWIIPLSVILQDGIGPWTSGARGWRVVALRGPGTILIEDDVGNRLGFAAGEFYDEIPDAVYVPLLGDDGNQGLFLLPVDLPAHVSVEGTEDGSVSLTSFSDGWVGSIATETSGGDVDEALFGTGSLLLSFTPGATEKARGAVIAHEFDDTSRIAGVNMAEAGEVTVSLDEEGLVTIVNSGSDTTYDLSLEQRGEGKGAAEFEGLSLADGATHFVHVSNWDNLDESEIVVEIDEDGDGDIDDRVTLRGAGGLEGVITAPLDGAVVSGTVVIRGSAGGDQFESYKVEVGPGANPSSWATVRTSTGLVPDGILGIWDASGVPIGLHTIRLTTESSTSSQETSVAVYVEAGSGVGGPLLLAPNPVGGSGTAFYYTLPPGAASASLLVLTVSGRLIFETSLDLYGMRYPGGGYWNPVDEEGVALASGPYVCVLVVDGRAIGQVKMLVRR